VTFALRHSVRGAFVRAAPITAVGSASINASSVVPRRGGLRGATSARGPVS
jgi:hypothetical protein